jgi:hypothetical protein
VSVFEDDLDEADLRQRLEADLGAVMPSVVPTEAILGQGKTIRHRHRQRQAWGAGTAGVTALTVAAGLLGHALLSPTPTANGQHPPTRHTVTVYSSAHDKATGMIGSGTVDGIAWTVAYQPGEVGGYLEHVGTGAPDTANPDGYLGRTSGPQPTLANPLSEIAGSGETPYGNYPEGLYFYTAPVPRQVNRLVIAFTDGESATIPAVPAPVDRFVAFLVPQGLGMSRITVYLDSGAELGYSIPFNGNGYPLINSWYTPNQQPTIATGEQTMGGTSDGTAWKIRVWAGPFGICSSLTMPPVYTGDSACAPPAVPAPGSIGPIASTEGGTSGLVVYAPVNPDVAKVVAVLHGGGSVTMPLAHVGGIGYYADVFPVGVTLSSIIAYDTAGHVLATATSDINGAGD